MAKQNINFNTFVPEDLTKSTIDWGAVATGLTTQLTAIKKDKEARRDKIEDDTYKKNRELRDLEQYDSPSLNQLVISASGSAQNFLKTQNDLFKRGLISETDYTKAMDRISGNFTDFSKAAKNYDASYKAYQDRIAADPSKGFLGSSSIEQDFAEGALAFGNLKGLVEYVNPTTGEISLVRPNDDGSIPKDPSKHMPFSGMNNRMNFRLDKFDVLGKTKTIVDSLGTTISNTGTLDDATIFTETATANKDKYISGFMAKDLDVASVLTDSMGDFYTTTDTNDTNPNAIHINYSDNNQPTIIDDAPNWANQKEKAKEYMGQVFDDQIDNKQKAIRTKFETNNNALNERKNQLNDQKYQEVKVDMPDYTTDRQIGPNNSTTTGTEYVTEALNEEIGINDSDEQILETYTSVTDAYLPPKVKRFYNNKGQGLKTTYVDDSIIMPLTIGDLPEEHPDRVRFADQPDKKIYVVMHQPTTVSAGSSPSMEELVNPHGTLLETEVFYNERSATQNSEYIIDNTTLEGRDAEYMLVDFAGRNLKIDKIRTKRSQPVWKQIQEEIINPAIQPYNDAEYSRIYSDNSMGNF
mgnify:FL=1|tara:strand:+ start:18266 stop:20008 length:1743 start_codon:yes stop_codon:yes gene_type:complete